MKWGTKAITKKKSRGGKEREAKIHGNRCAKKVSILAYAQKNMLLVLQISFLAILLLIGRQQDQKRGADENSFFPY